MVGTMIAFHHHNFSVPLKRNQEVTGRQFSQPTENFTQMDDAKMLIW